MDIMKAHQESFQNGEKLKFSQKCGCFSCQEIFSPTEIVQYDSTDTAICPKCGIDAVIADSQEFPVNEEFLEEMNAHWFGRIFK